MIFLENQLKRWRKANLLDESTATQILNFEIARWQRILLLLARFFGLPLMVVAGVVTVVVAYVDYGTEFGFTFTVIGLSLFFVGFFIWILNKIKIKREMLATVLLSLTVGATLLTYSLYFSTAPVAVVIADWLALGVVLFLLSRGNKRIAIFFGALHLIASSFMQDYYYGSIVGGFDGWIIFFVSSWRAIYLALSFLSVWLFVKVVIPGLKLLRKLLKRIADYVGKRRIFFAILCSWMIILGSIRNDLIVLDDFMGQLDWVAIGLTGLYFNLLSLIAKERPSFSILFCLFAWIEILSQVILVSHRSVFYIFEGISYDPGQLLLASTIATFFTIIGTFAKTKRESVNDVMGLGPLGFATLIILIASVRI